MSHKVCIRWDQIDFEVYGRNDKEKARTGRCYKNENILNIQWKYYEIVSFWSIYKRIAWSVSKFVYLSKPLFGAECWYGIFVCILYDVSLVYCDFKAIVETASRQKNRLSVFIGFHVLLLLKRKRQTTMFQFFHDKNWNNLAL